jgi:UDP-glucose 6-dehydrogenase
MVSFFEKMISEVLAAIVVWTVLDVVSGGTPSSGGAGMGLGKFIGKVLGFAGGTLARDVRKLSNLQNGIRSEPAIFTSLLISNRHNNDWISRSLATISAKMEGVKICFWGVSYTDNTDTLRRSEVYELMIYLDMQNAKVCYVENLIIKEEMDSRIVCVDSIEGSLKDTDILVVSKKLRHLGNGADVLPLLQQENIWVLDPSRILIDLNKDIAKSPKYLTVGKGK